jgi:heme/copper-type cytochrome/quinol oxidase subunit 4
MQRFVANFALSIILLAIPVAAQLATPLPNSMGLSLLLYVPFQYALLLLALALFLALNIYLSRRTKVGLWQGAVFGGVAAVTWFSVSFLIIGQLHLSLGGKL